MALLKGFPPSNTISCITRIPLEREIKVQITQVPVEARFRTERGCEFLKLSDKHYGPRAVCYHVDEHTIPGHIYGFDEKLEVTWYEEYFPEHEPKERKMTVRELPLEEDAFGK